MPPSPVKPAPPIAASSSASAFSIGTILFVLFKHKWILLLTLLLSIGGAVAYFLRSVPLYVSEAKLLVNYVITRDPIQQVEQTTNVSGRAGDAVIKAEIDILTSWDIAEEVVRKITPEKLMKGLDPSANPVISVFKGLTATAEKGGSVIQVAFQHSDPKLTQEILDQLIKEYFIKHRQIRASSESLEAIQAKVAASGTMIGNLDVDLKKLKGGSDLPLSQLTVQTDAELSRLRQELDAATLAYAEQAAWLEEVNKAMSGASSQEKKSDAPPPATGNTAPPAAGETPALPGDPPPPVQGTIAADTIIPMRLQSPSAPAQPARDNAVITEYQSILRKISALEAMSASLLKFTPEAPQVKDHESRLKELRTSQLNMVTKYPYLVQESRPVPAGTPAATFTIDLLSERAKLASIEARVNKLGPAYQALQEKAAQLAKEAPNIAKKERDREVEQKNFDHWVISQMKADANRMVPTEKGPGVEIVQEATPPALDSAKRLKTALAIGGGGTALGAIAVLVFGLLLNRSIKRPSELEEHLGVPLMMTIPYFSGKERRKLSLPAAGPGEEMNSGALTVPWRAGHFIRPFAESIRDRLGIYFERNNITHKPKLIGVTGYSVGAGVSTLAGGLAAALSEVGDGRVLLVDMNVASGKAHSFAEGLPVLSLSNAIKSEGKLQSTSDNLFLARVENSAPGVGSLLLKRLFEVIPNLKASEFDYIVFDLPPLGPTSPAAAMGGLLDTVVVVVEAETNSREEVKRGHRDLIGSGANISTVFNKARAYGPKALVGSV